MREEPNESSRQAWLERDGLQAISELIDGSFGCLFGHVKFSGRSVRPMGFEHRTQRDARWGRRHDLVGGAQPAVLQAVSSLSISQMKP